MPNAIRFHKNGGPEVMQWESVEVGEPGPGEARVRHTAIGVNYIDTYHCSGLYKLALPSGLGTEGAGIVEAVGPGVNDVRPGDRVAYSGGPLGAYSEVRVMPADRLVKLPDGVSDKVAATLMLKGLTVQYLFRQTFPLKGGETILLHAAAGGIGLIACQWARALGVTMIGTVGSDEKAALAKANGCTHTIVYTRENFVERVKQLTGGKGVPVVYDGVGKDTFPASLDCLSPRGMFVSFGNASGAIAAFDILLLAQKGSLYDAADAGDSIRPIAPQCWRCPRTYSRSSWPAKLTNEPRQTYALKDAAQAHRDLNRAKPPARSYLLRIAPIATAITALASLSKRPRGRSQFRRGEPQRLRLARPAHRRRRRGGIRPAAGRRRAQCLARGARRACRQGRRRCHRRRAPGCHCR